MSWININDSLPEHNQSIIFYGPNLQDSKRSNMWIGEYQSNDTFLCILGFVVDRVMISHWMPISESSH